VAGYPGWIRTDLFRLAPKLPLAIAGDSMMKGFTLLLAAGLMAAAGTTVLAQSYTLDKYPPPLNANDAFTISLPNPVVVGHRVLPPGTYNVKPIDIGGGELPVLEIRGTGGVHANIAAMIQPAFKQSAPAESGVSFYHIGNDYYFNRMWVQGLNYGYRFRLPKALRRYQE
jgi:hypothetical protein